MRAFIKFIVVATGLCLIAIGLSVVFLSGRVEAIAKRGIEKALTRALQTDATIDSVSLSPLNQSIELNGVTVASPKSFGGQPAMQFDKITLQLDTTTLMSKTPTIKKITLDGGEVSMQHELGHGTNLGAFMNRVKSMAAGSIPQPQGTHVGADSGEPKYMIQEIQSGSTKLDVSSSLLPGEEAQLELAPFNVPELDKSGPVSADKAAALYLRSMYEHLLASAKDKLQPLLSVVGQESGKATEQPIIEPLEAQP